MYGCEAWTLGKKEEGKLKAAEMWLYRQLLSIRWQDKRTNESVLFELGIERSLMNEINTRRLGYNGHAINSQKTDLVSTALVGRVEGCRKRERRAMSLTDNITTITGLSVGEVVHTGRDREGWRAAVESSGGATIEHGVAHERQVSDAP
ncbi:endonuclease-reverse transcriptase [Elysia marginata]|uniref:Endonuclease-reverse transcriptase n=1 Tax=Elysia marginata TaxID=1093978 RepID=A0AAV4EB14_9GAST|nr:endonuclease-reverse transcriptase [Elysia marginata]